MVRLSTPVLVSGPLTLALMTGGVVGYVVGRPAEPAAVTEPHGERPQLRALSPAEEEYAAALWPIHSEVKMAAIKATFAGILYKTGDGDLSRLRATLQDLGSTFERAQVSAVALSVPPSIASVHERYLEALGLYRKSASTVLAADGPAIDAQLLTAQELSFRASEGTLVVGDVLWPSEHKPH